MTKDKKLAIAKTPNQDNPLMEGSAAGAVMYPILGLDVWEHAYCKQPPPLAATNPLVYGANNPPRPCGLSLKTHTNVVNRTTAMLPSLSDTHMHVQTFSDLDYQNRRPEYIKAFWSIVNWPKVSEFYEVALNGEGIPF